jgi:hypothetical protein
MERGYNKIKEMEKQSGGSRAALEMRERGRNPRVFGRKNRNWLAS